MILKHRIAAIVFCVVAPAWSWLDGSGSLAWTMFSKSETYRVEVTIVDAAGHHHAINPTELAGLSSRDLATYLSGAESWRHGPIGGGLASNLAGLTTVACQLPEHPIDVQVLVETRKNLDAPVQEHRLGRHCTP